ncbi:MAG TPA: helix-turn-helix transcriptional regulator [Candidatus Saccharimonadales bacterium]|nr:helix-turn-helix transcriptional regulator [Candidatus Saccharimonadales bacterium]
MAKRNQPLTPAVFHILLALFHRDRHGYEIMQQVREDSAGSVKMGPGTLYGTIKRLLEDDMIEEVDARRELGSDERRRYYRLTRYGRERLGVEIQRLEQVVARATSIGANTTRMKTHNG